MDDNRPSKSDTQAILKKLRGIPTNKSCFDCNAKNPTWSSVTYGVFICIDCSAVHRGLGVHVSFVRSTQLDTNWTWLHLRQMQLGGNANAANFFRQHNCNTSDAKQKYTSQAAQMYMTKLKQKAVQAMKIHGTKFDLNDPKNRPSVEKNHQMNMLHLGAFPDKPEEENKEVDFFEEHSTTDDFDEFPNKSNSTENSSQIKSTNNFSHPNSNAGLSKDSFHDNVPTVNLSSDSAGQEGGDRKSLIGGRKPHAKKPGIGVKRGGKLGAQKVNANFAEIEREAEIIDQMKEKQAEEAKMLAEKTAEEEQKQMASMRLAYKDLSLRQKQEEEKLKQIDPKKAQQIERLGMGFSAKSGISHSALSDMETIVQENTIKSSSSGGIKYNYESDNASEFLDDYNISLCNYGMYLSENKNVDSLFGDGNASRDRYGSKEPKSDRDSRLKDFSSIKGWNSTSDSMGFSSSFDEKPVKEYERSRKDHVSSTSSSSVTSASCDDAQKKFGNAKAISSDQYFGDSSSNNWERQANLSRFEGSSSISSADFFGDGTSRVRPSGLTSSISAPDLDDVKESVRQGVTKVAGKISSLANGVLSSIQDRYGY